MWRIEHKCSEEAPSSHFAIQRSNQGMQELTRVACPNAECREYFVVFGHEFYTEADSTESYGNLPPGFVVARTRVLT